MLIFLFDLLIKSLCFRSMAYDFTKNNSNFTCPTYHRYMADLYPHTCIGYISNCNIANLNQVQTIWYNNYQVLCHPRFLAYNLMSITANVWTVRCNSPNSLTFKYDSNGDIIYTCEQIPNNGNCIIAQKYQNIHKCQYCWGYMTGITCQTLRDGGYSPALTNCPPNCKKCDGAATYCTECWPGFSILNSNDKLCSLKCNEGHFNCSIDSITGLYKFYNKCLIGYELINQDCIKCPFNCQNCTLGICNQCFQYYTMMNGICIGDANCISYDIIYDINNLATGVNCHQCDLGYYHNGIECSLCNKVIGMENCFLCNNDQECKTCWSGYYLNEQKKCIEGLGCSGACQTCLVDQPSKCTTCDLVNLKRKLNQNNECVCDQLNGWAEKYDICVKCTDGMCQTCTLNFFECLTCKTGQNRIVIDYQCVCQQGYYEDGTYTICQKCHNSCYNCNGPNINNCIECGDINIYHRLFLQNQCICQQGYAEIDKINIQQICGQCNYRCQTCSIPQQILPQKCTSCIKGQNRILSEDTNCICIDNYGDNNGITNKCFQCYYACGSCIGELKTECDFCSIKSNRYLTNNNECLCKDNYYEQTIQNIQCLRCHYTCYNCLNNSNDDQCIQCPSTRVQNDNTTTFKCLCADSHYFDDGISLECIECHYSCLTCNGPLQTNCLTCDQNYRIKTFSVCSCYDGFYEIGQLQCQQCHFSCMNCYGNKQDQCISCSNDLNRIIKGNTCVCQSGYTDYNGIQSMCDKCSYKCNTCSINIDKCINCPEFSFRQLNNNQCLCPVNLVDIIDNPICQICHFTCLTCNGMGSQQCLTCLDTSNRFLNNLNECQCKSHYYDVGNQDCQICSNYCLECKVQSNQCISCQNDRYLDNNNCLCKTKLQNLSISTFQYSNNVLCQQCHYSCLTCNGISQYNCLKCYDQDYRIQSQTSCNCLNNYYDAGISQCQKCNYRCQDCGLNSNYCISCIPNSFRQLNTLFHTCDCQIGYYDDGNNIICQQCHYSCQSCQGTSDKCQQCSEVSNRFYNVLFLTCNCNIGYYDNGIQICQQCHYSCLECNDQGFNKCKNCRDINISNRFIYNNICQCKNGYYDDGYSQNCQKCQIQCLNCIINSFQCIDCPPTMHLDGIQCKCNQGYYDTGLQLCIQCNSNCLECQLQQDNCISCQTTLYRILDNNKCICQNGYIEINNICQQCNITCKSCQFNQNYCTSCNLLRQLKNNLCICISGTYESVIDQQCYQCNKRCLTCINTESNCLTCSIENYRIYQQGNNCICQNGYYENINTLSCDKCNNQCLTCIDSDINCLSCDITLNLTINQNTCICKQSSYFNMNQCIQCDIQCLECKNQNQCTSCLLDTRIYDSINNKCPCQQGYYEINQQQCQKCDYSCLNCQNQSDNCINCRIEFNRQLINNKCQCRDGYYDIGIDICQKCSSICKTCQNTSINCLSCFDLLQIRQLSNNICKCQIGYYDNGTDICQKCSNECKSCINQNNYCTSCDINQKRIDQSIIHKCPCITGYYSDSNNICQKCHIKCSGCINIYDNCISCNYQINSNRLNLSQNCQCKNGYYDDNTQLNCQKCSQQCKTCILQSDNCQQCINNLRNNPPKCECIDGYFENDQQICEQCNNQCQTCQNNADNCITCKQGRIGLGCNCQDGYYEAGLIDCLECSNQCSICSISSENCTNCKGDRIEIPQCICQEGYYDDLISEFCQKCDFKCQTCNQQGCTSCAGNRILTQDQICDPPLNSICRNDIPWCSTCQVAILQIQFSDNLEQIQILFDFPLKNIQQQQVGFNYCEQIINQETILKLGLNPNCYIDQNQNELLIIELGSDSKINVGDEIQFNINKISQIDCVQKVQTFISNQLKYPMNLLKPKIVYEIPNNELNPCIDNLVQILSIQNDARQSLKSIIWSYQVEGINGEGELANLVQQLNLIQTIQLFIPSLTLPYSSKITFMIQFSNIIDQQTIQQILIITNDGQQLSIISKIKSKYYAFQNINLLFSLKQGCKSSSESKQYSINLIEIDRNSINSESSHINFTNQVTLNNDFGQKIIKYTLTPNTTYTFQLSVNQNDQLVNSQNFSISIIRLGYSCQLNGTQGIQDYKEDMNLFISCIDLDSKYQWNSDPDLYFIIKCIDLQTNSQCQDQSGKIIKVNETESYQLIKKRTIKPLSIQQWKIIAIKNNIQQEFSQIIVYLEDTIRQLDLDYNQGYLIRPVNNYERLQFDILIPQEYEQYLIDYTIAIIYNYEIVTIYQPKYHKFNFRLYEHYQNFNLGDNFYLKFSVQYSNYIMPSQYTLKLRLNQPPLCYLKTQTKDDQPQNFIIIYVNCQYEIDYPFQYQLKYFITQIDLDEYQSKKSNNAFLLYPFQDSNKFELYLLSQYNYVLIQIIDQQGSITNIYKDLTYDNYTINCTLIDYKSFNLIKQLNIYLQILLYQMNDRKCVEQSNNIIESMKSQYKNLNINEKNLVLQCIQLSKNIELQNNSQRILYDQNNFCYQNLTNSFQISKMNLIENKIVNDILNSLEVQLYELKQGAKELILNKIIIDTQINNDILMSNEDLVQKSEIIYKGFMLQFVLIDDIFHNLSLLSITEQVNKNIAFDISVSLLYLIENISDYINTQLYVNENQITYKGNQLTYQLQRITKQQLNNNLKIQNQSIDSLVSFCQISSIKLKQNFYNYSELEQIQIQKSLNDSSLTLFNNFYQKLSLRNYINDTYFLSQHKIENEYRIQTIDAQICPNIENDNSYNLSCIIYQETNKIEFCKMIYQQLNTSSITLYCECSNVGEIMIIQQSLNSNIFQNSTQNVTSLNNTNQQSTKLQEHPFILFNAILLTFSMFFYLELFYIEYNQNQIKNQKYQSVQNTDEKADHLNIFPGAVIIFQIVFKNVHPFLTIIFFKNQKIPRSYLFIKWMTEFFAIIFLSVLLIYIFHPKLPGRNTPLLVLLILIIIQIFKGLQKVFTSIFVFGNKLAVIIIALYFLTQIAIYIGFLILYSLIDISNYQLNLNLLEVIFLSIIIKYFLLDVLLIFIRIHIYYKIFNNIKMRLLNPYYHLIYFFVQHQQLDDVFEQFIIH